MASPMIQHNTCNVHECTEVDYLHQQSFTLNVFQGETKSQKTKHTLSKRQTTEA